jgi:hypothetical protein
MPEWMRHALCTAFPTLPWIRDAEQVSPAARTSMDLVCRLCPVVDACEAYVRRQAVVSGFWAGEDRDQVGHLEHTDGAA